jgi:Tfp pilus assembly protein PilF
VFVFALENLGAVLYRSARFDEALAQLDEAESQPRDPSRDGDSAPGFDL